MHYDTIILELLTRIKKLEDEMEELKQVVASIEEENANAEVAVESSSTSPFTPFAEQNN